MLAVLEFRDYFILIVVMAAIAGATYTRRPAINLPRLERQMRELQDKVDVLIKHLGIEMPPPPPSDMSPEVKMMAKDPNQKIAAIKLYRDENPGTGLAEAKQRIEEFSKTGR